MRDEELNTSDTVDTVPVDPVPVDHVDTVDTVDTVDPVDTADTVAADYDLTGVGVSDSTGFGASSKNTGIKYAKVITKSLIAWVIFFLIGIGFSVYHYFVPLEFTIDLTKGLGWKAVFSFMSICATKYIWIVSILCIFFTFKRKENPRYFSFILGFYILLLIFCVIGVVI